MTYRVELSPSAERDFRGSETAVKMRIRKKIDQLASNPRPAGVEKLQGHENAYRVRVGNYRILYRIFDHHLLVSVIHIGDRKDIYRR